MADHYDPVPDLAKLLDAALRAGWSALPYVDRLTEGLGLESSAGPDAAERLLREALGIKACTCPVGGGGGLVVPDCGGLEECAPSCGEGCQGTGSTSGTVCGVTPAALYRAECGNGHPRWGWLCARHAATAGLWCRECFEADGTVRYVTPALVPEAVARVTMPGRVAP